jgi:tRNA-dihydrouridine synthase B
MSGSRMRQLYDGRAVVLAPMEDVTDAVFRKLSRTVGADICVTEFVNVEGLLRGCRHAKRKIAIEADDTPTAIQIYGSDPERLAEAAEIAAEANPTFVDVNCGCWVPKIAGRGAGAGWLRDPSAMVAMAKMVVERVAGRTPVTVKTRIGLGPESHMPIVDLARRLEDVGVEALTLHCRTAKQAHNGAADWNWAKKAREVVSFPVIVNGDVRSGDDAERAIRETGCEGVMIGRRAIEHPWVFREARARIAGEPVVPPTALERLALCRVHLIANVEARGEKHGVQVTRRHLAGYLRGIAGCSALRQSLMHTPELAGCLDLLDAAAASARYVEGFDGFGLRPPVESDCRTAAA